MGFLLFEFLNYCFLKVLYWINNNINSTDIIIKYLNWSIKYKIKYNLVENYMIIYKDQFSFEIKFFNFTGLCL